MYFRFVSRITKIHREELGAATLSALLFFFVLCSYYILRPLREEMGIAGGVRNLPWLFQATLLTTLAATPLFGWLASRFPRRTFLPYTYRFFGANLLLFLVLLKALPAESGIWLGRVFYVWISVFNMFLVSLFWAFMAEGWKLEQSKRLFGFIAVGGSVGATAGAAITTFLVEHVGRVNLILFSVVLLEVAVQLTKVLRRRFEKVGGAGHDAPGPTLTRRGDAVEGIGLTLRSPYLLGISAFLMLYSFLSTILYFEQANIVAAAVADRAARAALFGRIDLWVNAVTVLTQLFFTARIMGWLGVGLTLALLPLLSAAGFSILAVSPVLAVLVAFQVTRRAANYALMRPARETLFTILSLREKYKAKSFIDTFVYRGGDALGSGLFDLLSRIGMGLGAIAWVAVPVSLLWAAVGAWLGRRQGKEAAARRDEEGPVPSLSPQESSP